MKRLILTLVALVAAPAPAQVITTLKSDVVTNSTLEMQKLYRPFKP